jgi:hypothetical protein
MPPLETIQTLISGGVAVVLAVGLWGFATGRVRVGSLVDLREQKLTEERDAWKKLALDSTPEIKRLGDLLEQAIDLLGRHK